MDVEVATISTTYEGKRATQIIFRDPLPEKASACSPSGARMTERWFLRISCRLESKWQAGSWDRSLAKVRTNEKRRLFGRPLAL